jgi:hypothetical protein
MLFEYRHRQQSCWFRERQKTHCSRLAGGAGSSAAATYSQLLAETEGVRGLGDYRETVTSV